MRRLLSFIGGRALRAATLLCLLPLPALTGTGELRFAWLSDTHVGAATAADDLRAAVRDINRSTGLSFVLVSGDLTEYGSLAQLKRMDQILRGLRVPCYLIPGNHDTKWSESGATDLLRLRKQDRFVFEAGGLVFIGLHQGPLMRMGDAHWAPQDVRWLAATLQRVELAGKPIVFITHYPVDKSIANWFEVLELLKRADTKVILCGHGHANKVLSFEGVPGVMGRSNLRARTPAGGFNVVEVRDGQMSFSEHIHGGTTKAPWHTVSLTAPRDLLEGPRPDFSVNARYPQVAARWKWQSGFTIAASPVRSGNLAVVGDASGNVTALNLESGQPEWRFQTGGPIYATPDASAETVVVTSCDGSVYGLDVSCGKVLWRFRGRRPVVACPRVAGGLVFLGSSEGKFRALALDTGKPVWEFAGLNGFVETRPLLHDGKVIFGAWDQRLYALEARSGHLAWKWQGGLPGVLYSPAACWPVAADGKVFIAAPDRFVTAVDLRTGEGIWRTADWAARESVGIAEDHSRLYVRSMNDRLFAISTTDPQPRVMWELDAGFGYDINSAGLVEAQGTLFYGTKNGLLLALDGRTGELRWQHRLGVGLLNTVTPLSARRVLASDIDGNVYLVEEKL